LRDITGREQISIAATIRSQINFNDTRNTMYLLGAKNLVDHGNGLSFRIRGSKRVNYIKITLNGMDLYNIEMGKIWGAKYTVVYEIEDVYNDMLHDIIAHETGLVTRLF